MPVLADGAAMLPHNGCLSPALCVEVRVTGRGVLMACDRRGEIAEDHFRV